jgi:hypothetical protein
MDFFRAIIINFIIKITMVYYFKNQKSFVICFIIFLNLNSNLNPTITYFQQLVILLYLNFIICDFYLYLNIHRSPDKN